MTKTDKQGMSIKSGVSTCYYSVFKHWQNWTIIRLQKCPNHSNSSEDKPPSTSFISVRNSKQSTRSHISWPAWFLTVIVLCGYYFYTLQTGKQLKNNNKEIKLLVLHPRVNRSHRGSVHRARPSVINKESTLQPHTRKICGWHPVTRHQGTPRFHTVLGQSCSSSTM